MMKSLFTLATGMMANQTYLDNISNNLANVNTAGFKRGSVNFQDLVYENRSLAGAESGGGVEIPTGVQIGGGVRLNSTTKAFSQGTSMGTGGQLDMAIQGKGFFKATQPDGTEVYTRDGSFRLNSQGQIVTSDGLQVSPAISVPNDAVNITIGVDGTVNAQLPDGSVTNVGQLQLVNFVNPSGLESIGRNFYKETPASGAPTIGVPGEQGLGQIFQGFLEGSNVETVTELVNMIIAQRAYEINSRGIRAADQMISTAASMMR